VKKILFIAHHRLDRSPGQRYRFEQVFDFLSSNGIECFLANIISESDEIALYHSQSITKKIIVGLKSYKRRFIHLFSVMSYDLVVIYREALPSRSTFFEKFIAKKNIPILFDFDDAIWVKDVSNVNKKLSWFKDEKKIEKLLPLCSHITCGNNYLADYAKKFNENVSIIPSTVDTDNYKPYPNSRNQDVVKIGWVGSHTTIKHFELITDVFFELKKKYNARVEFVVIGDENYTNEELNLKGQKWENEKEVELFNSFDIGVMPLPNDEWTKGKCGMKGLLYMSVGKPAVMSNVGMNRDIIENGVNGFLPVGQKQWVDVLSKLIEDKSLRKKIGENGRKTVIDKYSKETVKKTYLDLYTSLMN
jgi:glycosyltransferase involved in cell wall biosynthesis